MLFASFDCSCRYLSSSKGVRHELLTLCSKAGCLSFRCSALVCGANKRVTFVVIFAQNISFKFHAQCFLDAAVGAMNTLKAVGLATSA